MTGKTTAKNLAEGFNRKDVLSHIRNRRLDKPYAGTNAVKTYLSAVTLYLMQTKLPRLHTGMKKTCSITLVLMVIFLTVTIDNKKSLILQVFSGEEVDDDTDISSMSGNALSDHAKERRRLRLEYILTQVLP